MGISPQTFFRFLADNTEVVLALFERGAVDEAELIALIGRHRADSQPAVEHLRRQIEDLGIIERAAHADASFEVSQPVVEILGWLTQRQRLSSATVLRAYLDDIGSTAKDLADAVRLGDASRSALALKDLDGMVERVRLLSDGNRESVVTEAQALRSNTEALSAVDRFATVRRLWERHLEPLRQLVTIKGEMEQLLDRVKVTLDEGEHRFLAHGALQQGFSRTQARLARMRRSAADDHHAAVTEIAPLYERLRRDSRWLTGASRALSRIRSTGSASLRLDQRMGLTGWRSRNLLSDDKLRARFAVIAHYKPKPPAPIAVAPPPPDLPLITSAALKDGISAAIPIDDVLSFVLTRWPGYPLTAQLRAFGLIVRGTFGPVSLTLDAQAKQYGIERGYIVAWPLALREVVG